MEDFEEHIDMDVYSGDTILVMNIHDMEELMTRVSVASVARYERTRDPLDDRMKRSEAKKYVSRRGFKTSVLDEWERRGFLHTERRSDKANGAIWYSKADIERVIAMHGMSDIVVKDALYKKKLGI